MKKKITISIIVVIAMLCVTTIVYSQIRNPKDNDFNDRNIEALTLGEPSRPHGRWRTVGCGSYAFIDWKTYCCPNSTYDNCPSYGTCKKSSIYGCD